MSPDSRHLFAIDPDADPTSDDYDDEEEEQEDDEDDEDDEGDDSGEKWYVGGDLWPCAVRVRGA